MHPNRALSIVAYARISGYNRRMATAVTDQQEWTDQEGKAWWSVLRSSTLLLRNLGTDLQGSGLSLDWFDVLINIRQYPNTPMPLSELADNVVLSRSGLTRLLDRMEAAGLVQRTLSTTDRRRFDVTLRPAGVAEFDRVWPKHQEDVRQRFLQHLTANEMKIIHAGLAKVIDANQA